MTEHDCTPEEFKAWYNQLADLLATYDPRVARAMGGDLGGRTLAICLYGRQVKQLLDELTLLAQYKASTEAAKRRMQDPEFMAELRARVEARDRELSKLQTINRESTRPGEEVCKYCGGPDDTGHECCEDCYMRLTAEHEIPGVADYDG